MPDPTSPSDDQFADLFGKLPDPRARRSTGEGAERGSGEPAGRDDTPTGATAPMSRREARDAARRQTPGSGEHEPAAPRPAAPTPAAAPAAPERSSVEETPAAHPDTATAAPVPTATLDDLFTGARSTDSLGTVPAPAKKRRRRVGGWIVLGVVLLLLGGVAVGGLYVWNTYETQIRELMGWEEPSDYEPGLANGEAFVTVASGDTGGPISQSLYEAGVTMTPEVFYDYLIDTGQNPPFQPGVFRMQKQMTAEAALAALLNAENKMENSAQLREGLTVEQSLPILAEGIGLPIEDLQAAVATPSDYGVSASSLEGWLFPATYTFDPGVTAKDVITTLVNRAIQSLDAAGVPVEERQRVLTVASIIQREARFEADFYKVSRVIENRLKTDNQETFGLLQMDSTAQYGFKEDDGTVSTSGDALTDDNPWNTYVHPGLPVGPIANPGDVAIDAAMHPADGDWLYFVTVNLNTGETVFTTNIGDHERAREQWLSWCRDNPDAGC